MCRAVKPTSLWTGSIDQVAGDAGQGAGVSSGHGVFLLSIG